MKRALLLFAVGLVGCGGVEAPDPVPAPQPVAVDARDGWTGVAVPVPLSAVPGAQVSVGAPGYLTRVQLLSGPVYLWPQDEAFVRQLVYGEAFGGVLTRWSQGFNIAAPGFEDVAAQVAAEVSRVTGLPVTSGGTTGSIVAVVSEDDAYWNDHPRGTGYGIVERQGHTIIGAKLIFRSKAWEGRLNTFLHETGHALGLAHIDGPDVMQPTVSEVVRFSERETIALRMMYSRRSPGNAPPDRDGGAVAASGKRSIVVVE